MAQLKKQPSALYKANIQYNSCYVYSFIPFQLVLYPSLGLGVSGAFPGTAGCKAVSWKHATPLQLLCECERKFNGE